LDRNDVGGGRQYASHRFVDIDDDQQALTHSHSLFSVDVWTVGLLVE
jgi:hypothetical protein